MVLMFVVCGWQEEAVVGGCLRTYWVHSSYVFLCTRATVSLFWVKPTVPPKSLEIVGLSKAVVPH